MLLCYDEHMFFIMTREVAKACESERRTLIRLLKQDYERQVFEANQAAFREKRLEDVIRSPQTT